MNTLGEIIRVRAVILRALESGRTSLEPFSFYCCDDFIQFQ